jgi:flavin reductase (DIM6/NTAB) family NADH-FMN oxidoreductase RutF
MQVSFQPRLVACSLERSSTTLRNLRETGAFSVNILSAGDKGLAVKFCQPREAAKIQGRSEEASAVIYDKLAGISYQDGPLTAWCSPSAASSAARCCVTANRCRRAPWAGIIPASSDFYDHAMVRTTVTLPKSC